MFSLGVCLGRVWGTFPHKEGQRQMKPEAEERVGIPTDIKTGKSTVKEPWKPKELIGERDRKGDLTVFLTKTGTKVHLVKDCYGLTSADLTQIKEISICKYCLKSQRKID